jgi:hypothetical protein
MSGHSLRVATTTAIDKCLVTAITKTAMLAVGAMKSQNIQAAAAAVVKTAHILPSLLFLEKIQRGLMASPDIIGTFAVRETSLMERELRSVIG